MPLLLAAAALHAAPQEAPAELLAGMDVQVAADGSVASVTPDAGLPQGLRDALIRRVLQWRYKPATWRGKPVPTDTTLVLKLQPIATTAGGFAVRILGTGWLDRPGHHMVPPVYPVSARKAGVTGIFAYQVHVAEDGSRVPVRRLFPDGKLRGHAKTLDESARAAIVASRESPVTVDGEVIACERVNTMSFVLNPEPEPKVEGLKEATEAIPDLCPGAMLETKIEGELF